MWAPMTSQCRALQSRTPSHVQCPHNTLIIMLFAAYGVDYIPVYSFRLDTVNAIKRGELTKGYEFGLLHSSTIVYSMRVLIRGRLRVHTRFENKHKGDNDSVAPRTQGRRRLQIHAGSLFLMDCVMPVSIFPLQTRSTDWKKWRKVLD